MSRPRLRGALPGALPSLSEVLVGVASEGASRISLRFTKDRGRDATPILAVSRRRMRRKEVQHMRSVTRSVLAVAVVAMAFSATAATSALASQWYVGGSALTGSASLASATVTTQNYKFGYGTNLVECDRGITLHSASISSPGSGQVEHLTFAGCKMISPAACKLASETIESKPLTLTAALGAKSPEDTVLVKPTTGKTIAELIVNGEGCPFGEPSILTGKMTLVLPKGREELIEQELTARTGEHELEWENVEATLQGKSKLKLTSGAVWSFH